MSILKDLFGSSGTASYQVERIDYVKAHDTSHLQPYLCGPIHGCTDAEAMNWRQLIIHSFWPDALDPMRRDYRGEEQERAQEIIWADLRDIRECDFVICNFPTKDKAFVGSSMEVFYAASIDKPVFILSDIEDLSPWLRMHSIGVYKNLDELEKAVARIFDFD